MTFITLISLILFCILAISFIIIKIINHKRFESIRGGGNISKKGVRKKLPFYKNDEK